MHPLIKKFTWVTLFSIAMGFMETVVVVYLRRIYYPDGFHFPLVPMDANLAIVEIMREAATIIMLLGIGYLAGKNTSQKFAWFIFSFAIWDICYYIFLKLLLNWPESFLSWDILFLIPVPWVGPVIAPCVISFTMLILASGIIYFQEHGCNTRIASKEWVLLSSGSLTVIVSFIWDFVSFMFREETGARIYTLTEKNMDILNYVPSQFNWWLFATGELLIILGVVLFVKRMKSMKAELSQQMFEPDIY